MTAAYRTRFPFSAIVGQERMKQALVLALVHPGIGGVLIRGERGTGKSTAVRALAGLLPPITVVADCPMRCHPADPALMCNRCRERLARQGGLPVDHDPMRVVDLPLGATEEMVLGTLNIEKAVREGERVFEPGLLARAHRGFLYVDEVNLLPDHLADVLLDVAATGVNVVEREGVSHSHPSRFILVGTMNPEEGELRPQLQDRFALCADVRGIAEDDQRRQVVERCLEFERDPDGFCGRWMEQERVLADRIDRARRALAAVVLGPPQIALVARLAAAAGTDGHRADIAMAKAATAAAAYAGRARVSRADVLAAARLVLPHRVPAAAEDTPSPEEQIQFLLEREATDVPQDEDPQAAPPAEGKTRRAGTRGKKKAR